MREPDRHEEARGDAFPACPANGLTSSPLASAVCIGFVSGSGIDLSPMLDEIHEIRPFPSLASRGGNLGPRCSPEENGYGLTGHDCRFLLGRAAGRDVVIQCGRRHLYEGLTFREVTATVESLLVFGVRAVVLTNAVGGLRPGLSPGDLVGADRVRSWPYAGAKIPGTLAPSFVVPGVDAMGPYRWMHGPCYETRAEIRALRALGDATVGMSVAPELLRCLELGIPAAVVSCVTNVCGAADKLTHKAVLSVAQAASGRLCRLLRRSYDR